MADKKRRCSKGPKNELHNGKERRHSLLPDGTLHPTPFRPPLRGRHRRQTDCKRGSNTSPSRGLVTEKTYLPVAKRE